MLGAAALLVVLGSLAIAAVAVRRRVLPEWSGAPARLAETVTGLALLIGILELLGAVGLFVLGPIVVASALAGAAAWRWVAPPRRTHKGAEHPGWGIGAVLALLAGATVIAEWGASHDPVLRRRHPRVRLALVPPPVGGELRADGERGVAAVHRRRVPDAVLSRHRGDAARPRDRPARPRHAVARTQPGVAGADAAGRVLHRPPAPGGRRHDDRRSARDGDDDDGLLAGGRRRQRRGRGVLPAGGGGAADDRSRPPGRARAGRGGGGSGGWDQAHGARARARAHDRRGRDRPGRPASENRRALARAAGRGRRVLVRPQPDRGRQPAAVDERRRDPADARAATSAAHRVQRRALPDELALLERVRAAGARVRARPVVVGRAGGGDPRSGALPAARARALGKKLGLFPGFFPSGRTDARGGGAVLACGVPDHPRDRRRAGERPARVRVQPALPRAGAHAGAGGGAARAGALGSAGNPAPP